MRKTNSLRIKARRAALRRKARQNIRKATRRPVPRRASIRRKAAEITTSEYEKELDALAEDIVDEAESEEEAMERVWEVVDGHQWIIYNAYNIPVIEAAKGDADDVTSEMGTDIYSGKTFSEIATITTFYLMEQDLREKVYDLWQKKEEGFDEEDED